MDRLIYLFNKHPLSFVAESISLLPLLIGIVLWRVTTKEVKYLTVFFALSFVKDFTSNIFAFYKQSNLFIYNFFSLVEIVLVLALFYDIKNINSTYYKRIVLYGGVIALLINIFLFRVDEFSVGSFTIVRLYGIFIIMNFYYQVMSNLYIKNIVFYSLFWVSAGLLLYQSGTFFIFLLGDTVLSTKSKPEIFQQYWDTNLIFYIVFCLLSSIGILLSKYDEKNLI